MRNNILLLLHAHTFPVIKIRNRSGSSLNIIRHLNLNEVFVANINLIKQSHMHGHLIYIYIHKNTKAHLVANVVVFIPMGFVKPPCHKHFTNPNHNTVKIVSDHSSNKIKRWMNCQDWYTFVPLILQMKT